jgi:hypothetical protein
MLDIDLRADFRQVNRSLKGLEKEVEKAASRAINDSIRKSNTQAKRHVKKWMRLKKVGDAAKLIRLSFSRPETLRASITAQRGRENRPSAKHMIGTRAMKSGTVKWQSGGRTWRTSPAFKGKGKLNGHYFKRLPSGKLSKIMGPSAGDAVNDAAAVLKKTAQTHAVERFHHHVGRFLRRKGLGR